jgi:hypothetical protein
MNIYSSKRLKVISRHSPRFPLGQKRREHVQEALVKETGWNDEVESPEQREVLSVGRGVWYTTVMWTQLYRMGNRHFSRRREDEHTVKWPISTEIFVVSYQRTLSLSGSFLSV